MPHRPGHNRFGSSTGTTGGPAGMGSPPPSQNFGSNVVIGGNPGDAGGSTSSGGGFSGNPFGIFL